MPQGMGDGEYSPYRVYMTNVLTQVKALMRLRLSHNLNRLL